MLQISELQEIVKLGIEERRREVAQKKFEREQKLFNGLNYSVELYYLNEGVSGSKFEEIQMEGYDNAIDLVNLYRQIGHSLKLRKLVLTLNDEVVKRVNFKY